jgi:cell division protein ZapA
MAEVSISINGRAYDIECDEGQQGRIVTLASYIDQRVQQIARAGGAYNDAHILVLASLLLADELFEEREGAVVRPASAPRQTAAPADEQVLVRALDQLAKRIDGIVTKVQAA